MQTRALALCIALLTAADDPAPPAGSPAAAEMRTHVRAQLAAGRVDAALLAAQASLADHPDDRHVRREFVSLHLSLARGTLRTEDFATADRALAAVMKVDPGNPQARKLTGAIDGARRAAPHHVRQAARWLEHEWFDPAFRAYGQAIALLPDRRSEWDADFLRAAVGAGDDHYFTKNFHEAFYCYDAAIELHAARRRVPSNGLVSRWLQSMVHALARDIDRVGYPPDYWKLILSRLERVDVDTRADPMLAAIVRGIAHEDLGNLDKAGAQYGRVLGRPALGASAESVRRDRDRAIQRIRALYDPGLSRRRQGIWAKSAAGPWQKLQTDRFRIHHRNGEVAERVAAALRFHFDRIAALLGRAPAEIPWGKRADVYLHADADAFRESSGQRGNVQACSIIRRRGDTVEAIEIHAAQTDPLLLSTSLAHELTHLMVAAVIHHRSLAGALAEGIALHAEPRARRQQFSRLFARQKDPRGIKSLLGIGGSHPTEPAFYAQAHRLVAVLLPRGDISLILETRADMSDPKVLAREFGFKSALALQRAYLGRTAP